MLLYLRLRPLVEAVRLGVNENREVVADLNERGLVAGRVRFAPPTTGFGVPAHNIVALDVSLD